MTEKRCVRVAPHTFYEAPLCYGDHNSTEACKSCTVALECESGVKSEVRQLDSVKWEDVANAVRDAIMAFSNTQRSERMDVPVKDSNIIVTVQQASEELIILIRRKHE